MAPWVFFFLLPLVIFFPTYLICSTKYLAIWELPVGCVVDCCDFIANVTMLMFSLKTEVSWSHMNMRESQRKFLTFMVIQKRT